MAEYVAAIDQGTTSSRLILFDKDGRIQQVDQREHEQITPRAGWVEHDAKEIWRRTREVIGGAMASSDAEAGEVEGDRDHQPARDDRGLGPRDRRADLQRDRLAGHPDRRRSSRELAGDEGVDRLREDVGLPLSTYFSGPKITWILDHVDGRTEARRGAANSPSATWTPGCSGTSPAARTAASTRPTSPTPAARMLMDLETLDWHEPSLDLMGIPQLDAAGDPLLLGDLRRGEGDRARRRPGGRDPRRPAGGDVRPDLLRRRATPRTPTAPARFLLVNTGEEIVHTDKLLTTVGATSSATAGRTLHARGLDRGDRRAGAVAARPARDHQRARRKSKSWRSRSTTTAASTSSPPSPACSPRTGAKTPAGRSSA